MAENEDRDLIHTMREMMRAEYTQIVQISHLLEQRMKSPEDKEMVRELRESAEQSLQKVRRWIEFSSQSSEGGIPYSSDRFIMPKGTILSSAIIPGDGTMAGKRAYPLDIVTCKLQALRSQDGKIAKPATVAFAQILAIVHDDTPGQEDAPPIVVARELHIFAKMSDMAQGQLLRPFRLSVSVDPPFLVGLDQVEEVHTLKTRFPRDSAPGVRGDDTADLLLVEACRERIGGPRGVPNRSIDEVRMMMTELELVENYHQFIGSDIGILYLYGGERDA